jgi:Flp pilus assembly protein TadD
MTPPPVSQEMRLANKRLQSGDPRGAENIYRQVLLHYPNDADATHGLGLALFQMDRQNEGIQLIRTAISLNPSNAEYYRNLGVALMSAGQFDEVVVTLSQSPPDVLESPDIHHILGDALAAKKTFEPAAVSYRRAIELGESTGETWNKLGTCLLKVDRHEEAVAAFREAVRLKPDFVQAYVALGHALNLTRHLDEAIAASRTALRLKEELAEAQVNLGVSLYEKGLVDEALAAFERAVAINPEWPCGRYNLAGPLLVKGDYQRGWEEFEWRLRWEDFSSPWRKFEQPRWVGEDLKGKRILLYAEQGLGDTIQFVRYVPMVAQRGGRVILECQEPLFRLLGGVKGAVKLVRRGEELPPFDFHSSLLSLPRVFETNVKTIPASPGYVRVDDELRRKWETRISGRPGLKVGIVWAGTPGHKRDRDRSVGFQQLAPLAAVPGVKLFSLQKGLAAAEAKSAPAGTELVDLSGELTDFAETAAVIANLDLVISVDTSTAHLAGAMGKPVWVMIPFASDWRWMLEREDSPWYPTMRLFRQTEIGHWGDVILKIRDELIALAKR